MKNFIVLVVSIIFISFPEYTFSQDRNFIYFGGLKHNAKNYFGYNAAIGSMAAIDGIFVGEVDVDQGIEANVSQANFNVLISPNVLLDPAEYNDPKNIALGSSYGGILARMVEKESQSAGEPFVEIGGIITMGTPHQGARFMNSRLNGDAAEFGVETCNAIYNGVQTSLQVFNFSPFGILSDIVGLLQLPFSSTSTSEVSIDLVCDFVVDLGVEPSLTAFEEREGSPVLTQLNDNYVTNKPIVSIKGVEDSPLFFRQLYQAIHPPVQAPHLQYEDKGDEMESNMRGFFTSMKSIVNLYQSIAWSSPLLWLKLNAMAKANSALENALRWHENHEAAWSHLLGTLKQKEVTVDVESLFLCEDELNELRTEAVSIYQNFLATFNTSTFIEDMSSVYLDFGDLMNSPDCYGPSSVTYIEHYSTPSDGGIATDKMDYNGPVALNLTADGSGHSESMNHPRVWGHIDNLLRGDLDEYFDKASPEVLDKIKFFDIKN